MKTYNVFSKPNGCHNFHKIDALIALNGPAAIAEFEKRHVRLTGWKRVKWRGAIMRFECFDPSGQFNIVPA